MIISIIVRLNISCNEKENKFADKRMFNQENISSHAISRLNYPMSFMTCFRFHDKIDRTENDKSNQHFLKDQNIKI